MQLNSTQLPAQLTKGLSSLYVIHGAAPLLVMEAGDAIRAAARVAGYTERTFLQFDAKSDWKALTEAANTLSLFGDLRVLDIRIPSGKPGKQGADALIRLAAHLPEDTITLITLPQLDKDQFKTAWFNALMVVAVVVEGRDVPLEKLPAWLIQRAEKHGLNLSAAAAHFMAQKIEGNLLAAEQELLKLSLLCPTGVVSLEAAEDAVLDVARYDIQQFSLALQTGNTARAIKVLDSLQLEKEALPLLLWQTSEVLRMANRGNTRAHLSSNNIALFANQLALADRQFKGVDMGDAWTSLRNCIGLMAA